MNAACRLQRAWREYRWRCKRAEAAQRIQHRFRAFLCWKQVALRRIRHISALKIQRRVRSTLCRLRFHTVLRAQRRIARFWKRIRRRALRRAFMAQCIQKAWLRYSIVVKLRRERNILRSNAAIRIQSLWRKHSVQTRVNTDGVLVLTTQKKSDQGRVVVNIFRRLRSREWRIVERTHHAGSIACEEQVLASEHASVSCREAARMLVSKIDESRPSEESLHIQSEEMSPWSDSVNQVSEVVQKEELDANKENILESTEVNLSARRKRPTLDVSFSTPSSSSVASPYTASFLSPNTIGKVQNARVSPTIPPSWIEFVKRPIRVDNLSARENASVTSEMIEDAMTGLERLQSRKRDQEQIDDFLQHHDEFMDENAEPEPMAEPDDDDRESLSAVMLCCVEPSATPDTQSPTSQSSDGSEPQEVPMVFTTEVPWKCSHCDFVNEVSPKQCVMCDALRNHESTQVLGVRRQNSTRDDLREKTMIKALAEINYCPNQRSNKACISIANINGNRPRNALTRKPPVPRMTRCTS